MERWILTSSNRAVWRRWIGIVAVVGGLTGGIVVPSMHAKAIGNESDPLEAIQTAPATLGWERPRFEEHEGERSAMVSLIRAQGVDDPGVLTAMGQVPRHRFVPERYVPSAYADTPLPIGYGQTISQPYIVAYMTDLLQVEAGERVLEIGTGSGYQAAVLFELTPDVYTIEIIEELGEQAAERLEGLGYGSIRTKIGDGYYGWGEEGPFDRIIVTCAAGHIPPSLVEQLKPGGRMVIPVGGIYEIQYLVLVRKDEEGVIRSERLLPVRFVPMTGRAQQGG